MKKSAADFGGGNWKSFGSYLRVKNDQIAKDVKKNVVCKSDIFSHCFIRVNGRIEQSISDREFNNIIAENGGEYSAYGKRMTHLVADQLAEGNKSWRHMRERSTAGMFHIVTSSWVLESDRAARRLPEANFLPEMLRPQGVKSLRKNEIGDKEDDAEDEEQEPCHDFELECTSPTFVKQFFSRSRLHQLGKIKATIVNDRSRYPIVEWFQLTDRVTGSNVDFRSCRRSKTLKPNRLSPSVKVMFVDFDAFFVEASLTPESELRLKAVAVTHGTADDSRAEIASCNYIARSFGIKAKMSLHDARTLCPELRAVRYDFKRIKKCSELLFDVLFRVTPRIIVASVDEAYLQLIGNQETGMAENVAIWVRKEVLRVTGLTVSIGIGPNRILAKLAGNFAKPNSKIKEKFESSEGIRQIVADSFGGLGDNLEGIFSIPVNVQDVRVKAREEISLLTILPLLSLSPIDVPGIGPGVLQRVTSAGVLTLSDLYRSGMEHPDIQRGSASSLMLYELVEDIGDKTRSQFVDADYQENEILHRGDWKSLYDFLVKEIGEVALVLIAAAMGLDRSRSIRQGTSESIQINVNYGLRFPSGYPMDVFLNQLANEASMRLQRVEGTCSRIKFKILIALPGEPLPKKYGACGRCYFVSYSKSNSQETSDRGIIFRTLKLSWDELLLTSGFQIYDPTYSKQFWIPKASIGSGSAPINCDRVRGVSITLERVKSKNLPLKILVPCFKKEEGNHFFKDEFQVPIFWYWIDTRGSMRITSRFISVESKPRRSRKLEKQRLEISTFMIDTGETFSGSILSGAHQGPWAILIWFAYFEKGNSDEFIWRTFVNKLRQMKLRPHHEEGKLWYKPSRFLAEGELIAFCIKTAGLSKQGDDPMSWAAILIHYHRCISDNRIFLELYCRVAWRALDLADSEVVIDVLETYLLLFLLFPTILLSNYQIKKPLSLFLTGITKSVIQREGDHIRNPLHALRYGKQFPFPSEFSVSLRKHIDLSVDVDTAAWIYGFLVRSNLRVGNINGMRISIGNESLVLMRVFTQDCQITKKLPIRRRTIIINTLEMLKRSVELSITKLKNLDTV